MIYGTVFMKKHNDLTFVRIWKPLIGFPGSLNDINIADRSSVIGEFMEGPLSNLSYKLNDRDYSEAYVFADGMYYCNQSDSNV
jgi:hypothetical protein